VNIVRLKIITTYACNLRCKYCFEYRQDLGKTLTLEDLYVGINKAKQKDYLREGMQIMFFGGEPLLNFKCIPTTMELLSNRFCYYIYSNGVIFSEELVKLTEDFKFKLVISFDGIGQANSLRVFPNGSLCDVFVLSSIEKYIQSGLVPMVDICIHDISVHRLFDTVKRLSSIGVRKFEFRIVQDYFNNLSCYEEQLKKLSQFYIERVGSDKEIIIDPPFESAYLLSDGAENRWPETSEDMFNLELHPGGKLKLIPCVLKTKYRQIEEETYARS
jgi:sulfatase maturation enzyme AslB (radical SAM superfamily)